MRVEGSILTIDSANDLDLLLWHRAFVTSGGAGIEGISFAKMRDAGVDAIFLTERGERATRFTHPRTLYGWDCESVLVLNPAIISPIDSPTPVKIPIRRRTINIARK